MGKRSETDKAIRNLMNWARRHDSRWMWEELKLERYRDGPP